MTPWTVACQAPLVQGILQARILQWAAISLSGDLPYPGIEPGSPELQADSLLFELQVRPMDNLIGIVLNLYIALDNMAILTMLILPV